MFIQPLHPRARARRHATSRNFFIIAVLCFSVLLLWNRIVVTVPPGSVGVLWLRFFGGSYKQFYFGEGTKLIFPWDKVFIYDARLRRLDRVVEALTSDGLRVEISFATTYSIEKFEAADLQQSFGPAYETTLIEPLVISQLTLYVSDRAVEMIYSLTRRAIEAEIIDGIQTKLLRVSTLKGGERAAVKLVDINIHRVSLPEAYREAVELKLSAQQEILRRQYIFEQQRVANDQRILEARGVATVQSIVTPGLTDAYLQWDALRVRALFATSPNAKTVIVDSGGRGVPFAVGIGQPDAGQALPRSSSPIPTLPLPGVEQ